LFSEIGIRTFIKEQSNNNISEGHRAPTSLPTAGSLRSGISNKRSYRGRQTWPFAMRYPRN